MSPSAQSKFKNPRARFNFQGRTCSITGVGSYVPTKVLTNAELEKMVDTSDEWIITRTGIKERRIAADNEFTADMAAQAAMRAMKNGGITPDQIDLIIVATITPDMPFPATACLVQHKIGARRAAAFDVEAACSGFIYALEIGQQFITSRTYNTVLVIGAEKLSTIVDWKDRNTCVLFGDGAGAAILQHRPDAHGLLTACMGAEGDKAELLCMPGGGSRCPATIDSVKSRLHFLRMDGKETFKSAVTAMYIAAQEALRRCEINISQIKCVIPHQANRRIIDAVGERLGVKPEQVFVNLEKYRNHLAGPRRFRLYQSLRSRSHQTRRLSLVGLLRSCL